MGADLQVANRRGLTAIVPIARSARTKVRLYVLGDEADVVAVAVTASASVLATLVFGAHCALTKALRLGRYKSLASSGADVRGAGAEWGATLGHVAHMAKAAPLLGTLVVWRTEGKTVAAHVGVTDTGCLATLLDLTMGAVAERRRARLGDMSLRADAGAALPRRSTALRLCAIRPGALDWVVALSLASRETMSAVEACAFTAWRAALIPGACGAAAVPRLPLSAYEAILEAAKVPRSAIRTRHATLGELAN